MSQPPSIAYRSGPPAPRPVAPSEFDHAYEQERGRWLRRRYIYYTSFSLALGLLIAIPSVVLQYLQRDMASASLNAFVLLVSNGVYIAGLVVALRSRPVYARVLRIALATYIIASLLAIGFTHTYYMMSADEFHAGTLEGMNVGESQAKAKKPVSITATTRDAASRPARERSLHYSYVDPLGKKLG